MSKFPVINQDLPPISDDYHELRREFPADMRYRIAVAIYEHPDIKISIRRLASLYDLPATTLSRRIKGYPSRKPVDESATRSTKEVETTKLALEHFAKRYPSNKEEDKSKKNARLIIPKAKLACGRRFHINSNQVYISKPRSQLHAQEDKENISPVPKFKPKPTSKTNSSSKPHPLTKPNPIPNNQESPKMTDDEETELATMILWLQRANFPAPAEHCHKLAMEILAKRGITGPPLGLVWIHEFLGRHPLLKDKYMKPDVVCAHRRSKVGLV